MSLVENISIWAKICEKIGIKWYLYRETLLCANGYQLFPEELNCVQVAIGAEDLSKLVEKVNTLFPESWQLDMQAVSNKKEPLQFIEDGKAVLQIDVLWPIENKEEVESLRRRFASVRKKVKKIIRNKKIVKELLGIRNENIFKGALQKETKRVFQTFLELASKINREVPFYTDVLTDAKPQIFDKECFKNPVFIECGNVKYPVFSNYHTYLEENYGDYESGLTDSIGVGLTVEEKAELQFHQEKCKEALVFLQELSEEFNLQYYLLAGSVLGPVRDGGFIPWDDDIDVGIRVEHIEEFEKIVKEYLPKRLPKEFELVQSGANNPYPRMFSKICYEGRCCMDLWPLVPTEVSGIKAKLTWCFAKIITKAHYYKIHYKVTRFLKIVKPICFLLNDKQIMKLARYNERKDRKKKTTAYINLYSIYSREKETIRREWLDTPATKSFDGLEVPVVGCTEQYLEHLYGNYMMKPAPWKRASRHVERFFSQK